MSSSSARLKFYVQQFTTYHCDSLPEEESANHNREKFCLITLFILSACGASTTSPTATPIPATPITLPTATPPPLPDLQPAITGALSFFDSQYNPTLRLLRESPTSCPNRYWLATDNLLATYALTATGQRDQADDLRASMARYGDVRHDLVEVLIGEEIAWPPRTATTVTLTPQIDAPADITSEESVEVNNETRSGEVYTDWEEYADLTLYGALNAHNRGDMAGAQTLYETALAHFDGVGFADKAYLAGRRDAAGEDVRYYATYKLALAPLRGRDHWPAPHPRILAALLGKQEAASGGFITLYNQAGVPQGDANTETTAHALLALSKLAP